MVLKIDSTVTNVIVSVISGVLVSFLLFILNRLWKDTILPWYENQIYKDLKIEGRWYGLSFDSVQNIINLERKGHSVEGSMICLTGLDKGEEYIIKGTFKNLVLSLLYETKDSIKTDRGSLTLMAKNNGCRLKGQIACYDNAGDIINVGDVIWYRTEIDLMNRLKASEFLKDKLDSLRTERLKLRIQKTEIESDIENLIMNGTLQNIKAEGENYSEASEGDNH